MTLREFNDITKDLPPDTPMIGISEVDSVGMGWLVPSGIAVHILGEDDKYVDGRAFMRSPLFDRTLVVIR